MVVEGLDVGEDTHGIWFTPHDHHVIHLDQPVAACLHFCSSKSQFKVVFAVGGRQRIVVKLSGEEGVNQSTESHPITPTGRKVLDVYVLVAYCLRAAPLKKDLFYAAGAGNSKTLRALQFGFRVHWFGATVTGFRVQSLKDRSTSLSTDVSWQSL